MITYEYCTFPYDIRLPNKRIAKISLSKDDKKKLMRLEAKIKSKSRKIRITEVSIRNDAPLIYNSFSDIPFDEIKTIVEGYAKSKLIKNILDFDSFIIKIEEENGL